MVERDGVGNGNNRNQNFGLPVAMNYLMTTIIQKFEEFQVGALWGK